jgi:hypothetical protein
MGKGSAEVENAYETCASWEGESMGGGLHGSEVQRKELTDVECNALSAWIGVRRRIAHM